MPKLKLFQVKLVDSTLQSIQLLQNFRLCEKAILLNDSNFVKIQKLLRLEKLFLRSKGISESMSDNYYVSDMTCYMTLCYSFKQHT